LALFDLQDHTGGHPFHGRILPYGDHPGPELIEFFRIIMLVVRAALLPAFGYGHLAGTGWLSTDEYYQGDNEHSVKSDPLSERAQPFAVHSESSLIWMIVTIPLISKNNRIE
jgi:hypothetical protein